VTERLQRQARATYSRADNAIADPAVRRVRASVEGTVQGVGFRPFTYRLAHQLAVIGWIRNDERGVLIEAEAPSEILELFLTRLRDEAPPLASVERIATEDVPNAGGEGFAILTSARASSADTAVLADVATCVDCLRELFDPADRRFGYPFINCTNCGPRFTIVRAVPYDRERTTMAAFEMCTHCQSEYDDPADRRFHAEANACAVCGPRLRLLDAGGHEIAGDALSGAVTALESGSILAVKGLGGYHLSCLARDEAAVARLRERKHREHRPFALMAPTLEAAAELVELDAAGLALLEGHARPIVLAPRRVGTPIAVGVAAQSQDLGVMLAYSPLHHLLLARVGETLVMTSANVADEPIAYRDEDVVARLDRVADGFLNHDRPIETRTDDSVVRLTAAGPVLIRRSRGYVPAALALPIAATRPILACGAELKSTFCIARARRAWVSQHIGDLRSHETVSALGSAIDHFERLFALKPEIVVHDLHPDYLSTRYAQERREVMHVAVQHHHAHLAAVLAEHDETRAAVGAIYDGSGLGTDGSIWGGEVLAGDLRSAERVGHLLAVPLPGGDRAAREPWRMACAWLVASTGPAPSIPRALERATDPASWRAVASIAETGFATPITTSVGRLFDAVAALCGICPVATYEGQAAIQLESACDPHERGYYEIPFDERLVLDPRGAIRAITRDIADRTATGVIAARFHRGLARATALVCARAAEVHGVETAVLAGGVFQNRVLLEQTAQLLSGAGLRVLSARALPPGDGAIAYGQAAVAAAQTVETRGG
jgi:hydrogenase maturation protein HypF